MAGMQELGIAVIDQWSVPKIRSSEGLRMQLYRDRLVLAKAMTDPDKRTIALKKLEQAAYGEGFVTLSNAIGAELKKKGESAVA